MPASFKRFVEVGRVVLVEEGVSAGQLAVIVEIIDHNRAIIDSPSTGVARQVFPFKHLTLTKLTVPGLPRGAGSTAVKKFFDKAEVAEKWSQSGWAKKRAAVKTRRSLSDFDRFNVMLLKKQRRNVLSPATKKASA
ncbi:Ribosomal protein L14 [Kalmanozyma brasiliensis GHG001]|uniref:Putative RPL14B-ribosomal protein n=1 Tax=Kalmanozyma brasiliensis (strain GHG001) TaxID=1365824 RepID=V5EX24_KALBG|nr:Ribosomal protein L14 [Kalmanozyma brasiliensis GHG001]EST10200.1 Ribosomal protein L14 [Kalmanozyma brasiliensis GHG001]